MKINNIIEKITEIEEITQKNNKLINKRIESISELSKKITNTNTKLDDIRIRHNRESHFIRDYRTQFIEELKSIEEERNNYLTKMDKCTSNFNVLFEQHKSKLNEHYYALQKAFNDYIETKENNSLKEISNNVADLIYRLDKLETTVNRLFFEGPESKVEK